VNEHSFALFGHDDIAALAHRRRCRESV
jgi:uncharacterized membrane protein YsdA (DUF1294 family)